MPVEITGLYEAHLTVTDLDRAIDFYQRVVGLELAHTIPARGVAFFWMAGRERSMLGLWAGSAPNRMRLHVAFAAPLEAVEAAPAILRSHGVVPRDGGGGAVIEEPVVFPWMPAAAVYFDDPDGNSLEYIAILPEPARPSLLGRVPLGVWRAMHP